MGIRPHAATPRYYKWSKTWSGQAMAPNSTARKQRSPLTIEGAFVIVLDLTGAILRGARRLVRERHQRRARSCRFLTILDVLCNDHLRSLAWDYIVSCGSSTFYKVSGGVRMAYHNERQ